MTLPTESSHWPELLFFVFKVNIRVIQSSQGPSKIRWDHIFLGHVGMEAGFSDKVLNRALTEGGHGETHMKQELRANDSETKTMALRPQTSESENSNNNS